MNRFFWCAAYSAVAALAISLVAGAPPALAQSDTLRASTVSMPPGRGNPLTGFGTPGTYTWSGMFDTLTVIDETGDVAPSLAASWKNVAPTKWEFTLRAGVKFHNGEPMTAASIAADLNFLTTDAGKATVAGGTLSPMLVGARALNELTLEIETTSPNPEIPREVIKLFIVEPKAWNDLGVEGFSNDPVGTGAYRVVKWEPEKVTFVAFEDAWRRANIKNFTVVSVPDQAARAQALLAGSIDLAPAISVDAIDAIEAAGGKVDIFPAPYIMAWPFLSLRDIPFKDKRVRQAANYAVNKEAIVRELMKGTGFPAGQGATRKTFGYNPNVDPYPYDPEKARQLLTEAGYPNGFKMTVELLTGFFAADAEIYQQAASDLTRVGIETDIVSIAFGDFLTKIRPGAGKPLGYAPDVMAFQMDFPLGVGSTAANNIARNWSCRRANQYYCNEDELEILAQAETEFDLEKRRAKLQELMALFHENAPGLFLVEISDLIGRAGNVHGVNMVDRIINYYEITKSE